MGGECSVFSTLMTLKPSQIRSQFPFLDSREGGRPIVYLDNAATTQKPQAVLDALHNFYVHDNANVHRGMHGRAERATIAYENARKAVQKFLNAAYPEEIVFTKNCTEAINLVAACWGRKFLKKGDIIVLSMLEHHSNTIPWFQLREEQGITIKWIDIDDEGNLKLEMLDDFLKKKKVKLVAITGQSNVLGTRPPLKKIIKKSHDAGALVLVDAAQLIAHHPIDVRDLDCDFLAFSGHKIYGPTGIGVLYGKSEYLEAMSPWLGGGMMIQEVTLDRFMPADIPQKFEGGTPPIAQTVGLGAAIDWLSQFAWKDIEEHESALIQKAVEVLSTIDGLTILGTTELPTSSGPLSFTLKNIHPHDLTDILGQRDICLRAGHHCAQPLHKRLGITASTRLSVGIYNTMAEIELLPKAIEEIKKIFHHTP